MTRKSDTSSGFDDGYLEEEDEDEEKAFREKKRRARARFYMGIASLALIFLGTVFIYWPASLVAVGLLLWIDNSIWIFHEYRDHIREPQA